MKEFRPINLVGGLYKLLSKVLANRLKTILGEVVSDTQHACIQSKQILNAMFIASEAIDSRLKGDIPSLLLKMDIEKVCDHVNWDFLLTVMTKMGFGQRWISQKKWCISTTSLFVSINGTPLRFSHSSKGLRQGDPLSLYLFILAMEALNQLLFKAISGSHIFWFKVG